MKTIKIKELGIEVETKLRPKVLRENIKIPKGWRLLKGYEYLYLAENKIIPVYNESRQWVTLGDKVACLYSDRYIDGDGLHVNGNDWLGNYVGYAFGVRFCRDLKKEKEMKTPTKEVRARLPETHLEFYREGKKETLKDELEFLKDLLFQEKGNEVTLQFMPKIPFDKIEKRITEIKQRLENLK